MRWSQAVAATILAVWEVVAIVWFATGNAFPFPIGNFVGFFAVVAYVPAMTISLIVNQLLTGEERLVRRDRALLVAEFLAIAASLAILSAEVLVLENFAAWLVSAALAIAVGVRLRAR